MPKTQLGSAPSHPAELHTTGSHLRSDVPHYTSAFLAENVADPVEMSPATLKQALREVPRGTFAVAGIAVALVISAWLLTFFFLFLPRGPIG